MAPVEYRNETTVRAPREEAFAWWTDFTVDDHAGDRSLRGTRSEMKREGDTWTWTDEYVTMGLRTRWSWRVVLHPPQWEELHGDTKLGRLDGVLTFGVVAGGGTRVEEVGTFTPKGVGILLLPLLRRSLIRLLADDFKEHWAEFRRERSSA